LELVAVTKYSSYIHFITRVKKNGPDDFTLLVASAKLQPHTTHEIGLKASKVKLTVEYGDFAKPLQKVVAALEEVTRAL
jgi:dipeptidyl-peptidase-3